MNSAIYTLGSPLYIQRIQGEIFHYQDRNIQTKALIQQQTVIIPVNIEFHLSWKYPNVQMKIISTQQGFCRMFMSLFNSLNEKSMLQNAASKHSHNITSSIAQLKMIAPISFGSKIKIFQSKSVLTSQEISKAFTHCLNDYTKRKCSIKTNLNPTISE